MIETRIKKIFDYITLENKYYTANDIAEHLKLSEKTIRNEIDLLNVYLINSGAEIIARAGKGYRFNVINRSKFENFLKKDWYKIAFYSQDYNDRDYRLENILAILLFSNSYIKQQELADLYYVSISQINKDIRKIKDVLKKYNLSLESKPYYGMKIKGREKDIRICIKNELSDAGDIVEFDENKEIYKKIEDTINFLNMTTDYNMPYTSFKNLVIHIYIAILRIKSGRFIKLSEEKKINIENHKYFYIAKKIIDDLSKNLDIDFPKDELIYIAMHLITKNKVSDLEKISPEVTSLVDDMLEKIYISTNYDLRDNLDMYLSLCIHLGPLLERIKFDLVMKNPLLEDIKKHPLAYQLATIASYVINKKFKTKLSEDEIAYIALHISNGIETKDKDNLNILIVCGSGFSSSNMMKIQLEKKFYRQIKTIEIADLLKLDTYDLDSYDFVISTIDLDIKTNTPIIKVDVIFKQKDIKILEKSFIKGELNNIYSIFERSYVHYDLELKNIDGIFKIISEDVEKRTGVDKEKIYMMLYEREKLGSTAYENSIAIPHILESISDETFLVIITLKKGVKWNDKKVKFVFSLFIGKELENMNLFYQKLGYFMNSENAINKAIKSKDKYELINQFLGEDYE